MAFYFFYFFTICPSREVYKKQRQRRREMLMMFAVKVVDETSLEIFCSKPENVINAKRIIFLFEIRFLDCLQSIVRVTRFVA